MNIEEEPLMSLRPQSEFEQLLWTRNLAKEQQDIIKALQTEIGVLKSEVDELLENLKDTEPGQLHLKCRDYKKKITQLELIIHKLRKENDVLSAKVIMLNKEIKDAKETSTSNKIQGE